MLRFDDDEMSSMNYIYMEGDDIIEIELSIGEYVDTALGINHPQGFDLKC